MKLLLVSDEVAEDLRSRECPCEVIDPHIRVAILLNGQFQVWDKPKGITIGLLDYRQPENPFITCFDTRQIGPQGDY